MTATKLVGSTEAGEAIQRLLDDIYREAYEAAFRALCDEINDKIKTPVSNTGLLGELGDAILKKEIPPDTPEAEAERRRKYGARIKAARNRAKLTQAELAAKLGIVPQGVANYEAGRSEPSTRNLIVLSNVLGVSTDWLLGVSLR